MRASGRTRSSDLPHDDGSPIERVRRHWESETAGVRYGEGAEPAAFYESIQTARYRLEPYIPPFAQFEHYAGKSVLEIGVGAGVDFSQFVRSGALATGVDLTRAAIGHTSSFLHGREDADTGYALLLASAESLPFRENVFDLVYSWGVLHHTPDPESAVREAYRVLRPGGQLKIMLYHVESWTCWLLWLRYGLLSIRPLATPRECVHRHLESPGTKAYKTDEVDEMLRKVGFTSIGITTKLSPADLLAVKPSDRYRGYLYRLVWALYPRWLVRLAGDRFGLAMLVTAAK